MERNLFLAFLFGTAIEYFSYKCSLYDMRILVDKYLFDNNQLPVTEEEMEILKEIEYTDWYLQKCCGANRKLYRKSGVIIKND